MRIQFNMRLDCKHSYAVEEDFCLHCEICDSICDGELYEHCMWDEKFAERVRGGRLQFEPEDTPCEKEPDSGDKKPW